MENDRLFALCIAAFPLLLTGGIIIIPVVTNYADHNLAQRAALHTKRWFWGHLLSGVAFGYGIIASCCIALYLFRISAISWDIIALPCIVTGAALQAFGLGADGIGPLAISHKGYPARLFFDGSRHWTPSVFIGGSVLFSLGQIILMIAVQHSPLLSEPLGRTVMIAAFVFCLSTTIPSGWGLYIIALSALVIYIPISWAFWMGHA